MQIELKKFTSNERLSEETICFSADLYVDGKKIGECSNRGHGDPILINYLDRSYEEVLEGYCKSLPPVPSQWEGISDHEMNAELYIDTLVEKLHQRKQFKNWCRTQTVIRLKSAPDSWSIFKVPYSPVIKAEMERRYGVNLAEILNESLVSGER